MKSKITLIILIAALVFSGIGYAEEGAPPAVPSPQGTAAILSAGTDTVGRLWSADDLSSEFSGATAEVEDDAYGAGWNGDDTHAPSQNATYDALQLYLSLSAIGAAYDTEAELDALFSAQVPDALFDAHTILAATADNTPAALTIAEQRVVGRETGGNIAALTLGVAAGNVMQAPADPAAHTLFGFDNTGNIYRPILIGANLSYDQPTNTLDAVVSISTAEFAAATLVIESEGIGSNDNDTTIPTSAAVKDYADSVAGAPANVTPVDTADEDATFYPLLVDGATGSQATETDGELSYNPSTGLYTIPNIALGTQVITDNAILTEDGTANADEWAIFTANGLTGKTHAEMAAYLDDVAWTFGAVAVNLGAATVTLPSAIDYPADSVDAADISTIVDSAFWDSGGMVSDGTQCADAAKATINSGPAQFTVICTDNDDSTLYGHIVMPDSWDGGTVTFELEYVQTAADTGALNSDVTAMCRGAGETINNTWGTEVAIDDAAVTGSAAVDQTTSAAVTPNGTCAAGDTLYWRWQMDATGTDTAVATLHILGMKMEYTSNVGD